MFGRKVAQMQGVEKMATGATLKVVRIAIFSGTPQMGDFSFKHLVVVPEIFLIFRIIQPVLNIYAEKFSNGLKKFR